MADRSGDGVAGHCRGRPMKTKRLAWVALAGLLLAGCGPQAGQALPGNPDVTAVSLQEIDSIEPVAGQTIYVPVYSQIYAHSERRRIELSVTLSVRNTALDGEMYVTSVRYYDTDGEFLREYLEHPIRVAPLGSIDYIVREEDTAGGIGANFIVEWRAETEIGDPVVEAVMIGAGSQQGISFTSPGRVIARFDPASGEPAPDVAPETPSSP